MLRLISRFAALLCFVFVLAFSPGSALAQTPDAQTALQSLQSRVVADKAALAEQTARLATVKYGDKEIEAALQSLSSAIGNVHTDLADIQTEASALHDKAKADLDAFPLQSRSPDLPPDKASIDARAKAQALDERLAAFLKDVKDQLTAARQLSNRLSTDPLSNKIQQDASDLKEVSASLLNIDPDNTTRQLSLQTLRTRVDNVQTNLASLQAVVTPLLNDSKARIGSLGPAPSSSDPAESDDIANARDTNKQLNDIAAAIGLQVTTASQVINNITQLQRAAVTNRLTEHNIDERYGVFDPAFWTRVAKALPGLVQAGKRKLGEAIGNFAANINSTSIAIFLLLVALGYVVAQFVRGRIVRWRALLPGKPKAARRYASSLDAVLSFVHAMLGVPLAITLGVVALELADLVSLQFAQDIGGDLIRAGLIGIGFWALARAILAAEHPQLRLLPLSDWAVARIGRRMNALAVVLGLAFLSISLVESLLGSNSYPTDPSTLTTALRVVAALCYIVIIASLLMRLRRAPPTIVEGQPVPPDEDINALDILRPVSWLSIIIMAGCLITGYVSLAVFAAFLPLMLICIVSATYILTTLVDSALTDNLLGNLDRRRSIANAIGVSSKNVAFSATLLSGVLRFFILVIAFLSLGTPFGFYSADMLPVLQRAYFGFQIGEMVVSPSSIVGGIVLFIAIWALTRLIRGWISNTLLPRTSFDAGLQNSIATIIGYLGVILAFSAALSELGVSMQSVGYVAGGLSLGIGLGLQGIASNFVSGLILLAERPVRIGDIIAAGGEEGFVRRISVRATEIETFDRATLIVPNSQLITGVVKNWVYGNTWSRLRIVLSFGYDVDVDVVRAAMLAAAEDDPRILPSPPPRVFLANMGTASIDFELVVVIASMETQPAVKSDLMLRILKAFRAKGIRVVAQLPAVPPPVVVSLEEALGAVEAARLRGEKPANPPASPPPAPAGGTGS